MAPLDVDRTLSFDHPVLRTGYGYWLEIAAGRTMPDRKDIDPRALGSNLHHFSLFNLRYDENRQIELSPRLIGEEFASVFTNLSEAPLEDVLAPDVMKRWLSLCTVVLDEIRPIRILAQVQHMGLHHMQYEMLLAPLSDGGADIRNLFVVQVVDRSR